MENEIWKPVNGYEESYAASSTGRIKSVERTIYTGNGKRRLSSKILSLNVIKCGYKVVSLCVNGRCCSYYVHRLVATAFINNADSRPCVNHINFDRLDNTTENLEWCTYVENYKHASTRREIGRGNRKLTTDNVLLMRKMYRNTFTYKQLARKFNVTRGTVYKIIKGKSWAHIKEIESKNTPQ